MTVISTRCKTGKQLARVVVGHVLDLASDKAELIGPELVKIAQKYRGTPHEQAVRECWEAAMRRIIELEKISPLGIVR